MPVLYPTALSMRPKLLPRGHKMLGNLPAPEGVKFDSRMVTTNNPLLPRACGNVGNAATMVYRPEGPTPTLRADRPIWVAIPTGTTHVRALAPLEMWRLAGGTDATFQGDQETLLTVAVRSLPPMTARAVMARAALRLQASERPSDSAVRAGACPIPEAWEVVRQGLAWFHAWKKDPMHPDSG